MCTRVSAAGEKVLFRPHLTVVIYRPMFEQDTICAVATPAGEGGIGIIKMSGRDAISIAAKLVRSKGPGSEDDRPCPGRSTSSSRWSSRNASTRAGSSE